MKPPLPHIKRYVAGEGLPHFARRRIAFGRSRPCFLPRYTAQRDRHGVTPAHSRPVFHRAIFDLSCGHPPAQGRRDGSTTCRRIISGGFLVVSFPIFCSSGSGLIFAYASRLATIATGGTYDTMMGGAWMRRNPAGTATSRRGTPPAGDCPRAHLARQRERRNHARDAQASAKRLQPLQDCGFPAMPYHLRGQSSHRAAPDEIQRLLSISGNYRTARLAATLD